MNNKLFVGGLPYSLTNEELSAHFASAGTVVSANIIMDRMTGRSKGFGFVEMSTPEEAQKAVQDLNETELGGRKIHVNEARPQENRPAGGGGGGRSDFRGGDRDRNRRDDNRSNRW